MSVQEAGRDLSGYLWNLSSSSLLRKEWMKFKVFRGGLRRLTTAETSIARRLRISAGLLEYSAGGLEAGPRGQSDCRLSRLAFPLTLSVAFKSRKVNEFQSLECTNRQILSSCEQYIGWVTIWYLHWRNYSSIHIWTLLSQKLICNRGATRTTTNERFPYAGLVWIAYAWKRCQIRLHLFSFHFPLCSFSWINSGRSILVCFINGNWYRRERSLQNCSPRPD